MPQPPRKSLPYRILTAFVACGLLVGVPAAQAGESEEKFEKAFELGGIQKVRLQNINGPVHVVTWDRDYLRVSAVKKARGRRDAQILKDTEIRVLKQATTINIETVVPKQGRFLGIFSFGGDRFAEVSYDLLLPPKLAMEVETVNGRIVAEKRTGTLSLNTVNGSVRVEAHEGPLSVNTVNGSVDVAFAGPIRPTNLETVNGSVTVSGSRDSSIRYELQTVNGRIRSDFAGLTVEGKWGPREARGTFNGGRERLSVETVNGEVRILMAESTLRLPPRP